MKSNSASSCTTCCLNYDKKMEVDEQQARHIGLINGYRTVIENSKVMERDSGAWWEMEDDGHIPEN